MGLLHVRVAIVTGGAGNLGAHISRLFAAQAAGVVVNDVNVGSGARVVGEIEAAGGWAVFDSTDVSTFAGGRALVQRAVDEFGTVDALALLAGRIPLIPLADVSEDEWDGVISSYLKGHYHPHPGGRTRHVRRSAMAASSGSRLYRALSATPTRRRTARPRPESSA